MDERGARLARAQAAEDAAEGEAASSLGALGSRLRQIRKGKSLSLAELSRASGVSVAMLSHIELGKATPSLKALDRLRRALGVSMVDLFPGPGPGPGSAPGVAEGPGESAPRPPVVRAEERISLVFEQIGLTKQKLSPDEISDLEMLLLVIDPGGGSGPEPWTRPGEKAGFVIEGTARLEIGGERYELNPGDSFQFDSSRPHRFECLGDSTARLLWIIKSDPIARAVDA